MVQWASQKSAKVWHTTSVTFLQFSSVITMLALKLLFTYLQLSKQLWRLEILRKWTVSKDPQAIHPTLYGKCPPKENLHTRKSEEILALYAVAATFPIIYVCILIGAGLNFSIKHVLYDSYKIFLSSRMAIYSIILTFSPPHVLIWPSTSICFNSGCWIWCL